jgi:integrase
VDTVVDFQAARLRVLATHARARGEHTVGDAWDLYQQHEAFARLRPTSRKVYGAVLARARAELPPRPCAADIEAWCHRLGLGGASPTTRNKHLAALRAVLGVAARVTHDHLLYDEALSVRLLRVPAKRKRAPDTDTLRRLLEAADRMRAPDIALAARLCAFGMLRISEVLGLRPTDCRAGHDGAVLVTVERLRDRSGVRPRKNADGGKLHVVRFGPDDDTGRAVVMAATDVAWRSDCARRAGLGTPLAEGWLLPWAPGYEAHAWRRMCRAAGVAMPRGDAWHTLRHYGATKMAEVLSVTEVQAALGDATATAALCYMGQVRGTTEAAADVVARRHSMAVAREEQMRLCFGAGGGPGGAREGATGAVAAAPVAVGELNSPSFRFSTQNQKVSKS